MLSLQLHHIFDSTPFKLSGICSNLENGMQQLKAMASLKNKEVDQWIRISMLTTYYFAFPFMQ